MRDERNYGATRCVFPEQFDLSSDPPTRPSYVTLPKRRNNTQVRKQYTHNTSSSPQLCETLRFTIGHSKLPSQGPRQRSFASQVQVSTHSFNCLGTMRSVALKVDVHAEEQGIHPCESREWVSRHETRGRGRGTHVSPQTS
jgi:hypothetical protein